MIAYSIYCYSKNKAKKIYTAALLSCLLAFTLPISASTLAIDVSMVDEVRSFSFIGQDEQLEEYDANIGDGAYFAGPFPGTQMWIPSRVFFREHIAFNGAGGYMKFEVLRDLAGIASSAIQSATLTFSTFHMNEDIPTMTWKSPTNGQTIRLQVAPYASAVDWDGVTQPETVAGENMGEVTHTVTDPYPHNIGPGPDDGKYLEDISMDVTSIVQSWLAVDYANHGFSLDVFEATPGEKYYLRVFDQDDAPLPAGADIGRLSVVITPYAVATITVTDPVLPADDLNVAFGNAVLGFNERTVTIRNFSAVNLNIGLINSAGTLVAPFSIPVAQDHCSNQSLAPAATCTFDLVFIPPSPDDFNGSFDIPSNDSVSPSLSFSVSGTGFDAPDIEVTNSSAATDDLLIVFGRVVTPTAADQTVTVSNVGHGDLIITGIAEENTLIMPFSIVNDNCSGQTVAVGSSCTLTVRFQTGDFIGDMSDSFDIASNDPDESSVKVSLTGNATHPEDSSSGSMDLLTLLLIALLLFWMSQCRLRQYSKKEGIVSP